VPDDPALDQMEVLLDARAMAPALARSLGRPTGPLDVRVRYLRYKPGTNLVVHYDATVDGRRHGVVAMIAAKAFLRRRAGKPENVALADMVNGRSPASTPLAYDRELDALIQWLPLDLSLPGLAEPPERLAERLGRSCVMDLTGFEEEPVFLAYKPRRRAVLRFGDHVAKVYANEADFLHAARGLSGSSECSSFPRPMREAEVPELRLTVQSVLEGRRPVSAAEAAGRAGALLARIHTSGAPGVPVVGPSHELAAAAASGGLLGVLDPRLVSRVRRLLRALDEQMPDRLSQVTSHGDFNASQLIEGEPGLGVVDFDAMCLAPAARDPANYAAHLLTGRESGPAPALAALDTLVEGYGSWPPSTRWYLSSAILRRAPEPFRHLAPDWPRRIERMLSSAERALIE
jgi:hypothetical protein